MSLWLVDEWVGRCVRVMVRLLAHIVDQLDSKDSCCSNIGSGILNHVGTYIHT